MGGYAALFVAGFRRQATYRAALLTGLAANVFFGVFRSAIFLTLYRQTDRAGGLDLADALTYVWVLQVVFGVVFALWMWEYPESVRSGNFVVDLLRPGDPLVRLGAVDLGRSSFVLLCRGMPQLLLPGLFVDLHLPTSAGGALLLAASLVLCMVTAFELRFLFGSTAFWTADYRGWWTVSFGALWLTAGFWVPVEYFPGALRWVAEHGPSAALLAMPVRAATGRGALAAVGLQLWWAVAIGVACRAVMAWAERHLVVHGG